MEGDDYGRLPACYRCHSQKLRCIRPRDEMDCRRCTRAGIDCVARPSIRTRHSRNAKALQETLSVSTPPHLRGSSAVLPLPSVDVSKNSACVFSVILKPGENILTNFPAGHTSSNDGDNVLLPPSLSWNDVDFENEFSLSELETGCQGGFQTDSAIDEHFRIPSSIQSPSNTNSCDWCGRIEDSEPFATDHVFSTTVQTDSQRIDINDSSRREDVTSKPQLDPSLRPRSSFRKEIVFASGGSSLSLSDSNWNLGHSDEAVLSDHAMKTPPAEEDWVGSLASLNSRLLGHRKEVADFIISMKSSTTPLTPWSPGQVFPSQPACSAESRQISRSWILDKSFSLALQLVRLLDHSTVADVDEDNLFGIPATCRDGCWSRHHTTATRPNRMHEDYANRLLLLSCYSRLLDIFSEFFACLQSMLDYEKTCNISLDVKSLLPSTLSLIENGNSCLKGVPELQARMTLDFAGNLIDVICTKFEAAIARCPSSFGDDNRGRTSYGRPCSPHSSNVHTPTDDITGAMLRAVHGGQATFSRQIADLKQTLQR